MWGESWNADSVSGTAWITVRGFDGATCETGVTKACALRASGPARELWCGAS